MTTTNTNQHQQPRKSLPSTVDALITHLDRMYADRCIGPDESITSAHRRAGQRDVVQYLLTMRDKDSFNDLEKHRKF